MVHEPGFGVIVKLRVDVAPENIVVEDALNITDGITGGSIVHVRLM